MPDSGYCGLNNIVVSSYQTGIQDNSKLEEESQLIKEDGTSTLSFIITIFLTPPEVIGNFYTCFYRGVIKNDTQSLAVTFAKTYTNNFNEYAEGAVKFVSNSTFGFVPSVVSENSYNLFHGTATNLSIDFNIDTTFTYFS